MRGVPSHLNGGGIGCHFGSKPKELFHLGPFARLGVGDWLRAEASARVGHCPCRTPSWGYGTGPVSTWMVASCAATWVLVRDPRVGTPWARSVFSALGTVSPSLRVCPWTPAAPEGDPAGHQTGGARLAMAAETEAQLSPAIAGGPASLAGPSAAEVQSFFRLVRSRASKPVLGRPPNRWRWRTTSETSSRCLSWSERWLPAIATSGGLPAPGSLRPARWPAGVCCARVAEAGVPCRGPSGQVSEGGRVNVLGSSGYHDMRRAVGLHFDVVCSRPAPGRRSVASTVAPICAKLAESLAVDLTGLEVLAADGIVCDDDLHPCPPSAERLEGFLEVTAYPRMVTIGNALVDVPREVTGDAIAHKIASLRRLREPSKSSAKKDLDREDAMIGPPKLVSPTAAVDLLKPVLCTPIPRGPSCCASVRYPRTSISGGRFRYLCWRCTCRWVMRRPGGTSATMDCVRVALESMGGSGLSCRALRTQNGCAQHALLHSLVVRRLSLSCSHLRSLGPAWIREFMVLGSVGLWLAGRAAHGVGLILSRSRRPGTGLGQDFGGIRRARPSCTRTWPSTWTRSAHPLRAGQEELHEHFLAPERRWSR